MARTLFFMKRHSLLILGLVLVGTMTLAALLAPWLRTHDPIAMNLDALLQAPSSLHYFGTDALGRDVFSRMLYGARVSLWVGFVSVGISVCIGVCFGLLAGYFRGLVDECIMRFLVTGEIRSRTKKIFRKPNDSLCVPYKSSFSVRKRRMVFS